MIEKLTKQNMPKVGYSVYENYPWGVTLTVTRGWNDLAAQATGFNYDFRDPKGSSVLSGEFTAIGGFIGVLRKLLLSCCSWFGKTTICAKMYPQ